MKAYNIKVNGRVYEVEVEVAGEINTSKPVEKKAEQAAAPTEKLASKPVAKEKAAAPKAVAGGAGSVTAPMPGTILEIKVSQGQAVKTGDVLMILEAMKMENEITAPADGTVAGIYADKGTAVNAGDVLAVLK